MFEFVINGSLCFVFYCRIMHFRLKGELTSPPKEESEAVKELCINGNDANGKTKDAEGINDIS